jgi:hypothetical protein
MDSALVRRCHDALEPIVVLGFVAKESADHLAGTGLEPGRMCSLASRVAPLGAVGAGVVTATFYSASPALIGTYFPRAWTCADPADVIAARYAAADVALRRVLGPEIVESAELAELAGLVRAAAEAGRPDGRPMFAAYADVEWPAAPHVALLHAAATVREHRGDGHVAALLAAETSGLHASITHASGSRDPDLLRRNRGWTEQEWAEGIADLSAKGVLDDAGRLTATGTALREGIEAETDRLATDPRARLGADRVERVLALSAAIRAVVLASGLIPPGLFT